MVITHEKKEGDGKKLISDGSRKNYSKSDEGGGIITLQRNTLAIGFFFSCLQVAYPKTK